jgi:ABC-2 type transport system ATP-binding protein
MTPAIALEGLSKHYGRVAAVKGLTFDVEPGEVFGFLGLNGAGKTTTIRLILDLLRPTAGRALVFGLDCQRRGLDVRAGIGYLPGELGLFGDMTGGQVLSLLARLDQRPVDEAWQAQLLDRLRLSRADMDRRIREYSTGMKRKLGIVQAFQHDPPLLVLDEPTEGLDPLMQDEFFALVREATRRGRTVFLSSHVLSEVERICRRVALIREGELALLASVSELQEMAPRQVRVVFEGPAPAPPGLPPSIELVEADEAGWELRATGPLGPLLHALDGRRVADIVVRAPRLEDILAAYYRRAS